MVKASKTGNHSDMIFLIPEFPCILVIDCIMLEFTEKTFEEKKRSHSQSIKTAQPKRTPAQKPVHALYR